MYFMVGGRRTQSALYRVTYTGKESTALAPAPAVTPEAKLRKKLELLHQTKANATDTMMGAKYLGHPDRHVRYAARVAVERSKTSSWMKPSLSGSEPWAVIEGAVAIARVGEAKHQSAILSALGKLDLKSLSQDQLLGWLRAHSLAFTRLGHFFPTERTPWTTTLPNF
jgi:hypothetical protein